MSSRRFIYTLILYLITPVVLLRLLWRSIKANEYRKRIYERFGLVENISGSNPIWIHTVSVGEFLATVPLIKQLMQRYPQQRILVTTTTPTGSERVRAVFGDSVDHCYMPYDLPGSVKRFLQNTKPKLVLIMETEIWPNLYTAVRKRGIPLFIANARLSQKSLVGYQKVIGLVSEALANVDHICARDKNDCERFQKLTTQKEKITSVGNIKFDIDVDPRQKEFGEEFKRKYLGKGRKVLVAASTHAGEDEQMLDAFVPLLDDFPDLLLLIVPRHPERFTDVANLCEGEGFSVVTRSSGKSADEAAIFVGDSMGEMMLYLSAADVAFIGGSLVPVGGHNMLEAIALGVPVISGKHVHNFQDVADNMVRHCAGFLVEDSKELAAKAKTLLSSEDLSNKISANGTDFLEQNRGAIDAIINKLALYLD